jgi:uncharacterized protein
MQFEWDPAKNRVNLRKHHIDFADVPEVFGAPMLTSPDLREDYGEERWIGIGQLRDLIVVIVFTEPALETIRIISARKALRHERQDYLQAVRHRLEKIAKAKRRRD